MTEKDMEPYTLFVRGNNDAGSDSNTGDDWDDTALIKAYDIAVNLAKEEVARRMDEKAKCSSSKQKKEKKKISSSKSKKWAIGDACRAKYSEDGDIYEAVIVKIMEDSGMCTVKYIGYENLETVEISSLLESLGTESQTEQIGAAKAEQTTPCNGTSSEHMDYEDMKYSSYSYNLPTGDMPPAPPLPPQLIPRLPENDADALSSMLMSWYISGFHTGYYHGLKHAQESQEKRKHKPFK